MRLGRLLAFALAALALSSCAYYNTYYLARKNYMAATEGEPYLISPPTPGAQQRFAKTVDYSKKLIASYPKSKWVDDAYLMWARSLLGRDDPLKTIDMLRDFDRAYPKSSLKSDAMFYLGVACRQAHKPAEGLLALDDFLKVSKPEALVPYALLERARVLAALGRQSEAATTAGQLLERFPKSKLIKPARIAHAEALLEQGEHEPARADFHYLGQNSADDEERFGFLLREADCIEAARNYDAEIDLLKGALAQERVPTPPPPPPAGAAPSIAPQLATAPTGPGADHYGRLRLRIGTAHLLAGRFDKALVEYREVVLIYPRTSLASEAQYRIGYAFETVGDDLEKARAEYGRVKDQGGLGTYGQQAISRLTNLDRLAQYRSAGGKDSLVKIIEAGFMLAELYLFQLDKPDRALEEYRKISTAHPGTPFAAKALNAEAWVLGRKLDRRGAADSLFWKVVREYPATEAQLAARDYLEAEGIAVPTDLIRLPEPPPPPPADTVRLTPTPQGTIPLGGAPPDSGLRLGRPVPGARNVAQLDSLRARMGLPPRYPGADSLWRSRATGDSARNGAPADTTHRGTALPYPPSPPASPPDTTSRR